VTAPLLRCRGARIEVDGAVLLDALDLEVEGPRVVLVGSWEPLFRLWSREATLARGTVEVLGAGADTALRENHLGIARWDPSQMPTFKAVDSLTASARLLGLGKRAATHRAEAMLDQLGLRGVTKERLDRLDRAAQRSIAIARAVLGNPKALAIERPFAGLRDDQAVTVESVLERAASGRQLLLNLAAPASAGPEARAVAAAPDGAVVVLRAGAIVAANPCP